MKNQCKIIKKEWFKQVLKQNKAIVNNKKTIISNAEKPMKTKILKKTKEYFKKYSKYKQILKIQINTKNKINTQILINTQNTNKYSKYK